MPSESFGVEGWRREIQRRMDELEDKVGATDSKVDRLMDRQQFQHDSNIKKLDEQEQSIKRIGRMLIGEKGDNGLVGNVTKMTGQMQALSDTMTLKLTGIHDSIGAVRDSVEEIKTSRKSFAKNVLIVVSILAGLITIMVFLGPSIRKAIGMNAAAPAISIGRNHTQQSTNSPAYTAAMQ